MTSDDLAQDYWLVPIQIGLEGPSVTVVTVTCPSSAWSNRGSVLILVSPNSLLTTWDGVFFELERRLR